MFKLSDLGTAKIYNQELAADVRSDVGGMMSFVGKIINSSNFCNGLFCSKTIVNRF